MRNLIFCSRSYSYRRVCYDLPVQGYRFTYRRAIPFRRLFTRSSFWESTRLFFPRVRGLVHTFNDLVLNADAWIVSHELELPRFLKKTEPRHLDRAYKGLSDPRCRFILPMSQAARHWMLRRVPKDLHDGIAAKTHVFTGGVEGPEHFGVTHSIQPRKKDQPLHLVFVGNDAFRKGGPYVLDAFDALRRESVNVTLTFIGRVDPDTYVIRVRPDEYAHLKHRLETTEGVTWIPHAPHQRVMATLVDAHVGLLPTLDDSLGWSVIEMMATGTPTIGSDVVALPELIDEGVTGRLIPIPRDEDNCWAGKFTRGDNDEIHAHTRQLLVDGLVDRIRNLYEDEETRLRMARQARQRYERDYTPDGAARRLQQFYDEAAISR